MTVEYDSPDWKPIYEIGQAIYIGRHLIKGDPDKRDITCPSEMGTIKTLTSAKNEYLPLAQCDNCEFWDYAFY